MSAIIIAMARLSKEQTERNRQAILAAATRLFRERGVDAVCIAEVMTAAGFTHGGFYNHFASKEELAAETVQAGFADRATSAGAATGTPASLRDMLHTYLSAATRDGGGGPACPSAAMVADAALQGGKVQEAFARGIAGYVTDFSAVLRAADPDGDPAEQRTLATRLLAEAAGALVLAQGVVGADAALSDELLTAAREGVERLLELEAATKKAKTEKKKRKIGKKRG